MNQTFKENPYVILGVPTDAEEKEIKKAYRKLALKHHPDRCQDPTKIDEANQKFVQISQSYEILTTPRLRREWNRENGIANDYSSEMDESVRSTSTAGFGNSSHHRTYADPNEKYTPAPSALSKVDKNAFGGKRIPGHKATKGGTSDNSPKPFQYQFSDPYEIWKRDFKDQFGFEYPGADYDFVSYDTPIIKPDHETQQKDKAALLAKNGIVDDGNFNKKDDFGNVAANNKKEKDKKDVKKVPFTFNPFNRKKKDNNKNNNNTDDDDDDDDDEDGNDGGALVVYDEKTGKKKTTKSKGTGSQLALRNSKSKDETQLGDYKGGKNETQLSEYKGNDDNGGGRHDNSEALVVSQGRNNRPVAMDVVTKTEGKVTTTITTITRPDGTTETMVMKTGLPKKKEDKKKQPPLPQLTNGEPDLLQLTNGDDPGNQLALVSPTPTKKKPAVKNNLLLGNGGKNSPKKLANNNDTSNDKALVLKSSTTSPNNNNSSNTKSTTNNTTPSSPKKLTNSTTTSSTSPPNNSSKSSNNTNTNSMKALALTDGTTTPTKKVASSSNNPLLSSGNKTKAGTAGFVNPMLAGKKK